jgi:hypothetical protein
MEKVLNRLLNRGSTDSPARHVWVRIGRLYQCARCRTFFTPCAMRRSVDELCPGQRHKEGGP